MTWRTFPERLQGAGISWESYQNERSRSGLDGDEDAWLSNFGDNVLECFSAFNVEAYPGFIAATKRTLSELSSQATKTESQLSADDDPVTTTKLRGRLAEIQEEIPVLEGAIAKGGEARYSQLSDGEKALHHAAFVTNVGDPDYHALETLSFEADGKQQTMNDPKGDILHQFRKDVNEGKLPTVSWLTAPERFSDYPTAPWYGASISRRSCTS